MLMDKKTANSNLFIIFHLLILFLFSIIAVQGGRFFSRPLAAFLYYLLLVALPVFLFVWLGERQNPWEVLGFCRQPVKGIGIGLMVGGMILLVFFASGLFVKESMLKEPSAWYFVLGTVFVGMAEEVLFRGFVLPRMMTQMSFIKANVFASLLFAALHVARLFQNGTAEIPALIVLFVFSLWLGYLYKRTRSVITVMLVHGLYNLAVAVF